MNLYLRLLRMLLRQWWTAKQTDPTLRRKLFFRVWPHDCDLNLHLTNSRYLAFMDLCRIDWFLGLGFRRAIWKYKWQFVVSAQEITYIRELAPFTRFRISTQLLGWDEKYFYVEHRVASKGRLHAIAHVRVAALQGGKVISMKDVFSRAGFGPMETSVPEAVDIWKQLLEHKKWLNQSQKS